MPKIHFCKKISKVEPHVQCGETNSDKLETGRYSICRKCRSTNNSKNKDDDKEDNLLREKIKHILLTEKLIEDQTIGEALSDILQKLKYHNEKIKEEIKFLDTMLQ